MATTRLRALMEASRSTQPSPPQSQPHQHGQSHGGPQSQSQSPSQSQPRPQSQSQPQPPSQSQSQHPQPQSQSQQQSQTSATTNPSTADVPKKSASDGPDVKRLPEQAEEEEILDGEELEEEEEEEEYEEEEEEDDEDDFENFTTSEIVTVYVGHKRKRFFLHRELICQRSPFMEKCLKKDAFDEGYKNELYLPEDDPKAFSIVVDWIYRNKLPARTEPAFDLCDLSASYCMADKFGMEELQNSIMDVVRASFSRREGEAFKPPNFSALVLTHQFGPPKSPLKRFYVEHLVHHMMKQPKWYHELKRNEPNRSDLEEIYKIPDLVSYVFKKIWQFQGEPWKDPATWDKCCYHVHATTVCPAKVAVASMARTKEGLSQSVRLGSGLPGIHLGQPQRSWPPTAMGVWNPGVGW
ncbi:hypothetical protein PV08_10456 [Exophiala spinifera]|uniref:BTB domain-containing protein n=1 Tax=Exophiala spinifera TaxID=91928 RepID=A0A0D1Y854_9EURO|nr:uncharacterized protein PV08_10456 [Exophiala spinifera]KIW11156.1 hypothetical protein PV08_10456 [Exophiala spinifera]